MEPFRMIIGGELVNGVSTLPVINPATEASIADCPRADESQLDQAVAAANSAFNGWLINYCVLSFGLLLA